MILDQIYAQFHNSRNIKEKKQITNIVEKIEKYGYKSNQVFTSMGEDAAAINLDENSEELILMTTDAILPEFVKGNPFAAGFSAIYVGIDDIMACGGNPIACSTILTYEDQELGKKVLEGIIEATNRFKIPLIRGHTTTDTSHISLSSTIIGNCKKSLYLSAKGIEKEDRIGIIWDRDGIPGKINPLYWNTITNKSTEEFYTKRSFIHPCIIKQLIHVCKDISNGGILGTLYQLLCFNNLGAILNLNTLEDQLNKEKFEYPLTAFLFLYLTSAFLISFDHSKYKEISYQTSKANMEFYELGIITKNPNIILHYNNKKKLLIDFEQNKNIKVIE